MPTYRLLVLSLLLASVAASRARAQQTGSDSLPITPSPRDSVTCDGQPVSDIEIAPSPPSFGPAAGIWRFLQNVAGRQHPATQPRVIESYLSLEVGKPCTEVRRRESERVLRATALA